MRGLFRDSLPYIPTVPPAKLHPQSESHQIDNLSPPLIGFTYMRPGPFHAHAELTDLPWRIHDRQGLVRNYYGRVRFGLGASA
jgi:hypothetical protein